MQPFLTRFSSSLKINKTATSVHFVATYFISAFSPKEEEKFLAPLSDLFTKKLFPSNSFLARESTDYANCAAIPLKMSTIHIGLVLRDRVELDRIFARSTRALKNKATPTGHRMRFWPK